MLRADALTCHRSYPLFCTLTPIVLRHNVAMISDPDFQGVKSKSNLDLHSIINKHLYTADLQSFIK